MKNKTIGYSIIVVLVIAGFVYITINKDTESSASYGERIYQKNMENKGIKITVLSEGTGEEVRPGDVISVNYTGSLEDGTVFDSNVDPKFKHVEPFTLTIGVGQVIKGWDEGVLGMKAGEKRKLEIAPEFAYGENGVGGVIPPNSTLIFEVELVSINK